MNGLAEDKLNPAPLPAMWTAIWDVQMTTAPRENRNEKHPVIHKETDE